jgi:stage V sporulation protein K
MEEVRSQLNNIAIRIRDIVKLQNMGADAGLGSLHIALFGPPGTGKSTLARVIADIYIKLGVVPENKFVEKAAAREALVAGYEGQSAIKVVDVLKQARGGVLFLDEAHSLQREGRDPFGIEAVDTLVPYLENWRKELVVILAGYESDMKAFFARTNKGLSSRFTMAVELRPYNIEELVEIGKRMIAAQGLQLAPQADRELRARLESLHSLGTQNNRPFPNGRGVRTLLESANLMRAKRTINSSSRAEVTTLTADDFQNAKYSEIGG